MRRLRALMRKELIHMSRDRRTLMSILILPLMQLFLLGYAANTDVQNVSAAVFDQDQSQASRALLDAYRAAGYFILDHTVYSEDEVTRLIDSGEVEAGIIIPPGYGKDLAMGQSAQVMVLIDGANATIASTALSAAVLIGQAYGTSLQVEQLAARGVGQAGVASIDVRTQVLYNPNLLSTYNMIPGLIGLILQQTTMMLTSVSIVRERERGTMEQLVVTPIRNWELMVAKIAPYILVSLVDVFLILVVGSIWFDVPVRGNVIMLFALTGLFIIPNLGIGLLISTVARTQQESQFLTMPIMLPSIFLAGFLFPIAAMPPFLQFVSRFIPLRYFLVVSRSVVIKGTGLDLLIPEVTALCVFSVVLVGLAILRFRKSLD